MPELPEVESVRRSLEPHLLGRVIARAEVRRSDFCVIGDKPRGASRRDFLESARIVRLERLGKQLAFVADDQRACVLQLGMSGTVSINPADTAKHTHAAWTLDDNTRIDFVDPRRFGGITCYPTLDALRAHHWRELGPDALIGEPRHLIDACRDAKRAIKAVLLDQSVLAGVGNIYADESLFRSGIDPRTIARRLTPDRLAALAEAVRTVLAQAVELRGSTLRDYRDPSGQPGSAQLTHAVYGRAGQSCVRCSTTLKACRLAQRATVWCPACQRRSSS
jgi:formamidopyrimidine-DNA glycosylase